MGFFLIVPAIRPSRATYLIVACIVLLYGCILLEYSSDVHTRFLTLHDVSSNTLQEMVAKDTLPTVQLGTPRVLQESNQRSVNIWNPLKEWLNKHIFGLFPVSILLKTLGDLLTVSFSHNATLAPGFTKWTVNVLQTSRLSRDGAFLYAFGDYFNSRKADVFYVTYALHHVASLCVASWNSGVKDFVTRYEFSLPEHVQTVEGIIPVDLNLDGLLDVIVVYRSNTKAHWLSTTSKELCFLTLVQTSVGLKVIFDTYTVSTTAAYYKDGARPLTHPLIADVNLDGYVDMVFDMLIDKQNTEEISSSAQPTRFVWVSKGGQDFSLHRFDSQYLRNFLQTNGHNISGHQFSSPHSSGLFDVNGDCIPDLVFDVTTTGGERFLEVWVAKHTKKSFIKGNLRNKKWNHTEASFFVKNLKKGVKLDSVEDIYNNEPSDDLFIDGPSVHQVTHSYVYSPKLSLFIPKGAQQLSFIDLNGDGTIDVLFPMCGSGEINNNVCVSKSESDTIGVACKDRVDSKEGFFICVLQWNLYGSEQATKALFDYLVQPCDEKSGNCRVAERMCQEQPVKWEFQWIALDRIAEGMEPPGSFRFAGTSLFPITLQTGDFNSDGYPDILTTVHNSSGSSRILLMTTTMNNDNVSLTLATSFPAPYSNFQFHQAVLYDINGVMNILALGTTNNQWWLKRSPVVHFLMYEQSVWVEPFYLKISAVHGLNCSLPRDFCRDLGPVSLGGGIIITGFDLNGNRFLRAAALLPRSSYSPLLLPYVFIGLAYMNNYVDYFYYGTPLYVDVMERLIKDEPHEYVYQDSQRDVYETSYLESPKALISEEELVPQFHRWISLIPNSFVIVNPSPRTDPSRWNLQLSVVPSKMFWTIFFAVTVILIIIGFIVWYLDLKERLEDMKEHQGFRCHFLTAI